ncbi:hypothetical protein FGO68_gene13676 [Halteria grandinella]|uniref:Uncharacterized protein n=1 Tax=Halteria grandinella TaxID=5974 RepID=A0A8J8NS74_HALGN|nr:hypothetical protein FGO68_gene13676 [Halteria grandinella]
MILLETILYYYIQGLHLLWMVQRPFSRRTITYCSPSSYGLFEEAVTVSISRTEDGFFMLFQVKWSTPL